MLLSTSRNRTASNANHMSRRTHHNAATRAFGTAAAPAGSDGRDTGHSALTAVAGLPFPVHVDGIRALRVAHGQPAVLPGFECVVESGQFEVLPAVNVETGARIG